MAILIYVNGAYKNPDAVSNVIRYITRTRAHETRSNELFCFGGCGVNLMDPTQMIEQFKSVQKANPSKCTNARLIYHEVLSLAENEQWVMNRALDLLDAFAKDCCLYHFYEMGFQVVYAIHLPDAHHKRLHIHFAVNTTSYVSGKKRHEYHSDFEERRELFLRWFQIYFEKAMQRQGIAMPVTFFHYL